MQTIPSFLHFIIIYINGFTKLYGRTVIEAHRLLKNGSKSNRYILITDEYFKALNKQVEDIKLPEWAHGEHECRLYDGVGFLSFYYFHYPPPLPLSEKRLIEKVP